MLRHSALLALALISSSAAAQSVLRWVDAEGITHYTDDPKSIPKGVTVLPTEGDPISEMGTPPPVPRPGAQPGQEQTAAANEAAWRSRFRAAREKIQRLEDEISQFACRTDPKGGTVRFSGTKAEYYRGRARCEGNLKEVERAKEARTELERTATLQAVPNEWRH